MDNNEMEELLQTIKEDLVQVSGPDENEVAALVLRAKGDERTLKEFAEATSISAPTLSRIVNGKITRPLTLETILKIADASKHDTVRDLIQLAAANGYMSRSEQETFREKRKLRDVRNGVQASLKHLMHTTIVAELFQRGGEVEKKIMDAEPGELFTVIEQSVRYDFALDVESDNVKYSWVFLTFPQNVDLFQLTGISAEKLARKILRDLSPVLLTDAWLPAQYSGKKISFCFVDPEIYMCFCQLMQNGKLHNSFSAVLIDDKSARLVEEKTFQTVNAYDSIFELPMRIALNFAEDVETEGDDDCSIQFVQDREEV